VTEQTNPTSQRPYLLRCGRVITGRADSEDRRIAIHAGRIIGVDIEDQAGEIEIDLEDAIITPGFVDVHVHGGGGFNLHTQDPDEIRAYAQWAPSSGTTSFLIGTVGVPGRLPDAELRAAAGAIQQPGPGAEALGVHLEGPYINVLRRGAHDPSWLRTPSDEETTQLLAMAGGHLRLITIAPELPGAIEMIRRLVAEGVTVSIGHTDATYEQARDAIKEGITHATHCFNAMRPLLHREPGALGAIIEATSVRGEIIADGVHVHPAAMRVLTSALGAERAVVVTDALPAAGLPDAVFTFGGQSARVIDGVARLADGTITGSVLTTAQGLRNIVELTGVPLVDAVQMLTINPARSARVETRKGQIEAGYDADLLIFDERLELQATICRGQLAYVTSAWRERLAPMGEP
jgi:N-acetylglucosamine-6-phosphate deacetylase